MKKVLLVGLCATTLVALAQSTPKAVLLRLEEGQPGATVLGALEGKAWVAADKLSSGSIGKIKAGLDTVLFNLRGTVGSAKAGGSFEQGGAPCDWVRSTKTELKNKLEYPSYALAAPWNPTPRAFKLLPNNNATYLAAVRAQLAKFKAPKPARITQLVQADLDGDKQLEVLIVAQSVDDAYTMKETGDYSLVLVRKIMAGKVQTFSLDRYYIEKGYDVATDTGAQQGRTNRIGAIADIDGNGSMEVFLEDVLYEGYGVSIHGWNGKGFSRLLDWGCGV
ncbi:MAG: hypothetical protein ACK41E_10975 [Deinococcales bacterium]